MDELQEIDVEQIMERIRENIRRRRTAGGEGFSLPVDQAGVSPALTPSQIGRGKTLPLRTDGQVAADLAILHSGYDVYHIHFTSHRRILGPLVVFVKKVLRQLLTPILTRQVAYNAANARVATYLKEQIEALGQQQAQIVQILEDRFAQLRDEIQAAHAQEFQRLRGELEAHLQQQAQAIQALEGRLAQLREEVLATPRGQALQTMRERVSRTERKLRRILYVLTDGEEGKEARFEPKKVPFQALEPDLDYFGFEERFRGSEEEIKERQRVYVEYFKGQDHVLDIGCGRGEFLELLREAGIKAKGVDIDLDMVLYCREKGLDVVKEDAFAYLEALPDESLGGAFAAQVIEHLEPSQIIQLVKLCHRKLRSGGILVLETLNPESLFVHYKWFWMDLTHTRLIHPETLKFLFESVGFGDVACRFLPPLEGALMIPQLEVRDHPREELHRFNEAIEYLNKLLYGSSDYAVVGKKGSLPLSLS